jgi:predicted metal-dependent enzyme (double-stranded beta helix superfamily)
MIDRYTLDHFIDDVERIVRAETSPDDITAQVAPLLGKLVRQPDCIPALYRTRPSGKRGRYILHRTPHFNVTSVVWGPGEIAPAHNHETWGVIGVIENEIEETRYRVTPAGPGRAAVTVREVFHHGPGAVSRLVPGDEVHAMHNPTDRDTVEIHVYGKDLVDLPRTTWGADGVARPLISPKYLNC